MLIWVGIAVIVLSFFAAFLGSWLARSADSDEAVADADADAAEVDEAAFEEALEEILPAGSAVRAGTGVPESGKGYEGDVYIDISNADVYLFQDALDARREHPHLRSREPDRRDRSGRRDGATANGRHRRSRCARRPGRARHAAHARPRGARERDLHRGRRRLHRHRDGRVLRVHRRRMGALRPHGGRAARARAGSDRTEPAEGSVRPVPAEEPAEG